MPFLCKRRTERTDNHVSKAPMVIGLSLGSVSRSRSIWANLWNGIIIADDKKFHKGFGSNPLTNSSTNILSRVVVEARLAMSLNNSSHVHPSRRGGGDFFGMPVNAFVTSLSGIGTKADS